MLHRLLNNNFLRNLVNNLGRGASLSRECRRKPITLALINMCESREKLRHKFSLITPALYRKFIGKLNLFVLSRREMLFIPALLFRVFFFFSRFGDLNASLKVSPRRVAEREAKLV